MMPLITRRSSTRRAPGRFLGSNGSTLAHCASFNQKPLFMIHAPLFSSLNHRYINTSMAGSTGQGNIIEFMMF